MVSVKIQVFLSVIFGIFIYKNVWGKTMDIQQEKDYPIYDTVPRNLAFSCDGKGPGYYADPEAQCQVWHWCLPNGRKYSFLCPNGTVFNQAFRVCDWWFNVDCANSPNLYNVNDDLYKDKDGKPI